MKLGDVRAGNYAQDKKKNLLMVIGFDSETKNVVYSVVDRKKYPLPDGWSANPIPMNEEWMERCGFKDNYQTMDLLFDYQLCFQRYRGKLWIRGHETDDMNEIEFVHEFQNIYRIHRGENPIIDLTDLI